MSPSYDDLLRCCGSTAWARAVAAGGPYADLAALTATGRSAWWALDPDDWREAFATRPRTPGAEVYEARYGMTYVVRDEGRTDDELRAILAARLDSDAGTELVEAAGQLWEITELRLATLG